MNGVITHVIIKLIPFILTGQLNMSDNRQLLALYTLSSYHDNYYKYSPNFHTVLKQKNKNSLTKYFMTVSNIYCSVIVQLTASICDVRQYMDHEGYSVFKTKTTLCDNLHSGSRKLLLQLNKKTNHSIPEFTFENIS